jgi:hypothetical protein
MSHHGLPRYSPAYWIQVVESSSALLGTADEDQIPVDADHSAMCKFEREDNPTFETVYKRVNEMKNSRLGRGVAAGESGVSS